ncbi:cell division protein FtsW (lipid II flippase) [Anaerosolibacter carboniphilus]|uniref:Cell division protein FtsW (Lipid II flippase) n=1 Tax=Anaerosolibacter carboniphilus TaxID=1417629 RepID=A0A841KS95_9FIRM|nr:FtsW/RodA/SpoVE family cell cycle protein [Anaerosolibacter carboniphilus]MBB6216273.1 cell division protein FtsW (lipid II flippase) [Anaerosolibacter carboniphilus]
MLKKIISYKAPQNLIVLINILALLLLFSFRENFDRNILISGVFFICIIYISNWALLRWSSGDHYLFLIMSMLISIGIIMIYRINPVYGFKQVIWFGVGIIIFFLSYFVTKKVQGWEKWTIVYAAGAFILFLSTLIFGVKVKGATNWIRIAGHSFQPAELIKLLFVFFLASYYTNEKNLKNPFIFFGIVYAHIGFLFIQRDLGTAMLFFLIFITILYVYEERRKFILYNIGVASLPALMSYFFINHVRVRVETWIDPWRFIDSKGYQITQSLFAIASGGFFGTGIGLGHPEFIPEVHNDFIFSAICEEMGIFGGMAVIMLFLILVYRGFKIALNQHHRFFRIVAIGITAMLGFQAFIILGGVTKLIPLTGITLPFVSYGGSSLVSSFAALGILQVASEELEQEDNHEPRIQEDC